MEIPRSIAHMMTCGMHAVAVCALAAIAACAGAVTPQQLPQPSAVSQPAIPHAVEAVPQPEAALIPAQGVLFRETGTASWYGKEFQGRKTASGEVFDMHGLTASHRTLPFGTIIRVTNLDNLKSVSVRITNRGPFVKSRILELSSGAAKELGFTAQGTALVKIETPEAVFDKARYTVQAAAYTEEENARMLKDRLSKKFELVYVVQLETNIARLFLVRIGSYASEERAEQVAGKLTLEGLEPIVLRKD
jgi:rare lipoprotein A